MPAEHVLAIDAGTSTVRCAVVGIDGHLVSLCHKHYTLQTPPDVAPLGKEFDPDLLWHTICGNVKEAIRNAGIALESIVGVSATSQREGAVFLDKEGRELYAGPNIDLRAVAEGISIDGAWGKEIYSLTGHTPSLLFVPAKLKWFESNRPETYAKIATVLAISDWILFRLSGEKLSEVCGASELGLVDIRRRAWSDELQHLLELPQGIYPRLSEAGRQAGRVTSQAAADMGILAGVAVATGGPDTQCGLLGMGVQGTRQVGAVLGWSAPIQKVTAEPLLDPEARTWTSCHLVDRNWVLESSAGDAGYAYRWLKETMFSQESPSEKEAYELMDRLALEVPRGANGALAFLGPSAMDMSRLSMKLGGLLFPVPFSVSNTQRGDLVRATLENLCFAIKASCLRLEAISGQKIEEVRIGGGLAKSRCLGQTLPAVLGVPVCVPETTEISLLGAAMCAAAGSGAYSNLREAAGAMKAQAKVIDPDRLAVMEYGGYYDKWSSTAKRLDELSEALL